MRDWLKSKELIDRDCIHWYEYLLGRKLKDYDEYSKYFSLLEKSDLEEVQDTAQITIHTTNVTYMSDSYQLVLQADLDEDMYKLVVTEY